MNLPAQAEAEAAGTLQPAISRAVNKHRVEEACFKASKLVEIAVSIDVLVVAHLRMGPVGTKTPT